MAWKGKIKTSSNVEGLGQRWAKASASMGLSELDRATGNNMGINKGLDRLGKQVAGWNPFAKGAVANIPDADQSALQKLDTPQPFEQAGFAQAPIETAYQEQFRQGQMDAANQLKRQMMGQDSIVQQQADRDKAAMLAASRASLASSRGSASPLAARAALMGNQQSALQMGEQAQINRLAEQQQAAQQYGQVAQQARAQDIDFAKARADQQNQFNTLKQQYSQMGMNSAEANQRAALDFERIRLGQANQRAESEAEAKNAQKKMIGGLINQAAGVAGQMAVNKTAPPTKG